MTAKPRSLLWVVGGKPVMRQVYSERGLPYWTSAADLLLQKHGYLDFDRAEPSVLDDPENVAGYKAIIVSWLPEKVWRPKYLESLCRFPGPVFLEGPFPDNVAVKLGLEHGESGAELKNASFVPDEWLRNGKYGPGKCPWISNAITGKRLRTFHPDVDRYELLSGLNDGPETKLRNVILLYVKRYIFRWRRSGTIFTDPLENATAALSMARFVSRLEPGPARERYETAIRDILLAGPREATLPAELHATITAVWGLAQFELAQCLGDAELDSLAARAATETAASPDGGKPGLWPLLLQVRRNPSPEATTAYLRLLERTSGAGRPDGDPVRLWLMRELVQSAPDGKGPAQARLRKSLRDFERGGGFSSERIRARAVPGLVLQAGICMALGLRDSGQSLFDHCFTERFDSANGVFRSHPLGARIQANRWLRVLRRITRNLLGTRPAASVPETAEPWIVVGLLLAAEEFCLPDVGPELIARYEPEQIRAWEALPVTPRAYRVRNATCLAWLADEVPTSAHHVGLARQGRFLATSFQALSYILYFHTMHPMRWSLYSMDPAIQDFEHYLLAEIESHFASFGAPQLRTHAWPWGYRYCLSIRHDVDRIPKPSQTDRLMEFHRRRQTGVSWYWIPGRLDEALMRRQLTEGHEIGLHSLKLANKEREIETIMAGVDEDLRVTGECTHGTGDNWRGYPNFAAAARSGLDYTEGPTVYDFPVWGFPALERDGTISMEPIVAVSRPTLGDEALRSDMANSVERARRHAVNGFMVQILNHPDQLFEELGVAIDALPAEGRLNWTVQEVTAWWNATHRQDHLTIQPLDGEDGALSYQLRSVTGVRDLELRLPLDPAGLSDVRLSGEGSEAAIEWEALQDTRLPGIRIRIRLEPNQAATLRITMKPEATLNLARMGANSTTSPAA